MSSAEFHKQSTLPNLPRKEKSVPLPDYIGPYKVESLLKVGSLTTLYLGFDERTHTPLVLKALAPELVSNDEMVEQFLKEAEIISISNHPNIVSLIDHGSWDGGFFLATEFIQGVSLLQFIERQSLMISSALDIILQVAYALLHLHTHGVVHRDIKPENILISDGGQIKVIDLGIAQLAFCEKSGLKGRAGRVIGTPFYMSPEQRENPASVTEQSDIYSLGMILYELVTGKISNGNVTLGLLPDRLRAIVEKMLAPALDERYHDIVDFITAISDYRKSDEILSATSSESTVLHETISKTYDSFLPQTLPDWPQFDIGLALPPGSHSLNIYYDFIKFADNSYLIMLTESNYAHAESLAFIGLIKGMIRTLTRSFTVASANRFAPMECITTLNELIVESHVAKPMACSFLYLCPVQGKFSLISCGFESLWHTSFGSTHPKILSSENPLLGERSGQEYFEISDNWNEGDTLFLHTFNTKFHPLKEVEGVDELLKEIAPPLLQKSASAQAKGILEGLSKEAKDLSKHAPKAVLSLQRIS